jgi:UDP-3-O-[3-hydroxymyristoyl] glucosamine N-acyltransferase
MIEYGINTIGEGVQIFEPVTLGFPSRENLGKTGFNGTVVGKRAVLRPGTVIYCDVVIGDNFQSGHNVLIREKTSIGNHTAVGTATIIDGNVTIGNNVSIQSMVYIPTNTTIGDHVFIGPNAVLTMIGTPRLPPGISWDLC